MVTESDKIDRKIEEENNSLPMSLVTTTSETG